MNFSLSLDSENAINSQNKLYNYTNSLLKWEKVLCRECTYTQLTSVALEVYIRAHI